jgi:hypothetical protein
MAVRLEDAMRRGALVAAHACGPDLLHRDWFADAPRPIDDIRAELGVVPKSAHAIECGSVTRGNPAASPHTNTNRAGTPRESPAERASPTAHNPPDQNPTRTPRSRRTERLGAGDRGRTHAGVLGRAIWGIARSRWRSRIFTGRPREEAPT